MWHFLLPCRGLGTKNAQKIIIELKNKMGAGADLDLSGKDLLENAEVVQALEKFWFFGSRSAKSRQGS